VVSASRDSRARCPNLSSSRGRAVDVLDKAPVDDPSGRSRPRGGPGMVAKIRVIHAYALASAPRTQASRAKAQRSENSELQRSRAAPSMIAIGASTGGQPRYAR